MKIKDLFENNNVQSPVSIFGVEIIYEWIEYQTEVELNEDWKKWIAAGALGAASLGTPTHANNVHGNQPTTQQSHQITQDKQDLSNTITGTPIEVQLTRVAKKAGLRGHELAAFLSQCAHESTGFTTLRERGNEKYFRKYDIRYNPVKANELGNIYPGDGVKFKGRGFIQLTGRANYTEAGKVLQLPLEDKPELLEQPNIAAKAALWYWNKHVHGKVSDFSNVKKVTKQINPGLNQLQKRKDEFMKYSANSSQDGDVT